MVKKELKKTNSSHPKKTDIKIPPSLRERKARRKKNYKKYYYGVGISIAVVILLIISNRPRKQSVNATKTEDEKYDGTKPPADELYKQVENDLRRSAPLQAYFSTKELMEAEGNSTRSLIARYQSAFSLGDFETAVNLITKLELRKRLPMPYDRVLKMLDEQKQGQEIHHKQIDNVFNTLDPNNIIRKFENIKPVNASELCSASTKQNNSVDPQNTYVNSLMETLIVEAERNKSMKSLLPYYREPLSSPFNSILMNKDITAIVKSEQEIKSFIKSSHILDDGYYKVKPIINDENYLDFVSSKGLKMQELSATQSQKNPELDLYLDSLYKAAHWFKRLNTSFVENDENPILEEWADSLPSLNDEEFNESKATVLNIERNETFERYMLAHLAVNVAVSHGFILPLHGPAHEQLTRLVMKIGELNWGADVSLSGEGKDKKTVTQVRQELYDSAVSMMINVLNREGTEMNENSQKMKEEVKRRQDNYNKKVAKRAAEEEKKTRIGEGRGLSEEEITDWMMGADEAEIEKVQKEHMMRTSCEWSGRAATIFHPDIAVLIVLDIFNAAVKVANEIAEENKLAANEAQKGLSSGINNILTPAFIKDLHSQISRTSSVATVFDATRNTSYVSAFQRGQFKKYRNDRLLVEKEHSAKKSSSKLQKLVSKHMREIEKTPTPDEIKEWKDTLTEYTRPSLQVAAKISGKADIQKTPENEVNEAAQQTEKKNHKKEKSIEDHLSELCEATRKLIAEADSKDETNTSLESLVRHSPTMIASWFIDQFLALLPFQALNEPVAQLVGSAILMHFNMLPLSLFDPNIFQYSSGTTVPAYRSSFYFNRFGVEAADRSDSILPLADTIIGHQERFLVTALSLGTTVIPMQGKLRHVQNIVEIRQKEIDSEIEKDKEYSKRLWEAIDRMKNETVLFANEFIASRNSNTSNITYSVEDGNANNTEETTRFPLRFFMEEQKMKASNKSEQIGDNIRFNASEAEEVEAAPVVSIHRDDPLSILPHFTLSIQFDPVAPTHLTKLAVVRVIRDDSDLMSKNELLKPFFFHLSSDADSSIVLFKEWLKNVFSAIFG
ncbi:uncharacterized protein MONOS_3112 [Monocercomonoides exilis]|uniref:uncharacterized protein n=1 Tax=Monocercomonoides exilis TaxID=2049356 RepID=UPI003559E0A6|nr:hypothetical protein MONOS_3112 [Monocercomonoides exilis]|eukprot:MONOS_3112.1-p1 / transcript=MONOS_3112.1 / gene=MONOS_3112 / organism=Monocercomonoides_exilis_PA203 / gene_product=unspecified product / transcript_product=unspecified product / location=Mono_scaffold00070:69931-73193(-) / protein_length=1071 / sequence_SO=supercontig / SO=protein_coding / is_pseudo=false